MIIHYSSDIHADFWIPFKNNQMKWEKNTRLFAEAVRPESAGEVLVVAGDLSNLNRQSMWLLDVWQQYYEQIFIVLGNHDYYLDSGSQSKKYMFSSPNRIKELQDFISSYKNIKLLEEFKPVVYGDKIFAGDTAWYSIKTNVERDFFYGLSNDSRLIKGFNIMEAYDKCQQDYDQLDRADIIITHVPPIRFKGHETYGNTLGYLTEFPSLKAPIWIAGHCHDVGVYQVEGTNTTVYTNAFGYPERKWQEWPMFQIIKI
ncbi:metallophosphoesterase [Lysinibacillus sp. BW-2-10]|uniref:metallophosphoesterase n=1 Tax=Lysinibacillus sp. BW-2-10 TaxID=2590030 RepID=UPI00117FCF3F|nr:metallophosphoesterase [Lysinibacillus sp. BW-2-10]TSI05284.1 hypothetical protein FJQ64_13335 [Lysinibacillus sp. BW-2-10]